MSRLGQMLLVLLLCSDAAAESKCPSDKDIKKRMDEVFAVTEAYVGALFKASSKWKTDCEVARKDLLALEPAATKFMTTMMDTMKWKDTLDEACREKVKALGQKHTKAAEMEKRYSPLEGQVKPVLERCKDHAGFQEAAGKGLRMMKKKKS